MRRGPHPPQHVWPCSDTQHHARCGCFSSSVCSPSDAGFRADSAPSVFKIRIQRRSLHSGRKAPDCGLPGPASEPSRLRKHSWIQRYDFHQRLSGEYEAASELRRMSLDYFPFPAHGWRISPGLLFYNANGADMTFTALPGTSFSLNNYTYYSSPSDPVKGIGGVGLHSHNPAFTITTGWGNMVRPKGHFSFPVEVGVALIGAPTFNMALTSGQVCDANGQNCVNVATDPDVQANLQAQVSKYRKDIEPLKTYPVVSFGVAYTFRRQY